MPSPCYFVMLSKVKHVDHIFTLNSLDESKISTSHIGLRELERLEEISINDNPTSWQRLNKKAVKIASLNCAGLKPVAYKAYRLTS